MAHPYSIQRRPTRTTAMRFQRSPWARSDEKNPGPTWMPML